MPLLTESQKAAWVRALRGGNFAQGHQRLYSRNPQTGQEAHCCLGVLCEILLEISQNYWKNDSTISGPVGFGDITPSGDFSLLSMPSLQSYESLARANDAGVSFSAIAAHIERYMPTQERPK